MPPDLSAAIDAWIAAQPDPRPTRPEAICRLVKKGLTVGRVAPHMSDAFLERQIAKAEAAVPKMSAHSEPSPAAGLAATDKAVAQNELTDVKNKRTRRKNPDGR